MISSGNTSHLQKHLHIFQSIAAYELTVNDIRIYSVIPRRYMADILPAIRRTTLFNQSINQSLTNS